MITSEHSSFDFFSIRLKGRDAATFCHRLFSRNLLGWKVNEGAYTLLLSPEAKIESAFWCVKSSDGFLFVSPKNSLDALKTKLQHYHFGEDIEWGELIPLGIRASNDLSPQPSGTALLSPEGVLARWNSHSLEFSENNPSSLTNLQRWELKFPLLNFDYDQTTSSLFLEWDVFCDEQKGCYPGQEIIERFRSRGGIRPKTLQKMVGKNLEPNQNIYNQDRSSVGKITNTCFLHESNNYAFGYIEKNQPGPFYSEAGLELMIKP